jgi:hypothetical protein
MKTGVLFFAINNGHYDYLKIAAWNAKNVRRWLDTEIAVVTNQTNVPDVFDYVINIDNVSSNQRYFPDLNLKGNWFNTNRLDAFNLTPFDQTLVLDVDYVVCSSDLHNIIKLNKDFLCFKHAYDITNTNVTFNDLNYFGEHRFPMAWATVMCFTRSNHAEFIFDSMKMIRDNWQHYRNVYKIIRPDYRNDYALSIALGLVSGHTNKVDYIPWSLATVPPEVEIDNIKDDEYFLKFERNNKPSWLSCKAIDFHALGKANLEKLISAN